ncbi:MAG: metallophosphoesterase [Verrucomicrobia bacterium]|nr:metallophosphoesterase [Verrucomicrobiota bacterium]
MLNCCTLKVVGRRTFSAGCCWSQHPNAFRCHLPFAAPFAYALRGAVFALVTLFACGAVQLQASVLFEADFEDGIPGWTAVQPPGVYLDGPLRWEFDFENLAFVEQSNIYTDNPSFSPTATAPMLINDATTSGSFTYGARLTAGDDDAFGLIFGYQDPTNFYRVVFTRQARTGGFPWSAWSVDRKVNGVTTNLFGYGKPGYVQTFVNTANRPFDVTVLVNGANQLTLTVVDNPTVSPVNYPLVVNQPLPAASNGKVGIFTWGMSGGTPRGFRIQNLSLSPGGMVGGAATLSDWTPLIPPRMAGNSATLSGAPYWAVAMGQHGPFGTLQESGDCFAGNDAAGQVDFTGPTIVAGNDAWTNYVVAARILPHDDDGHGILLRYQNPTNFYRIALRSQVSTLGVPPGLSVQKNVNRVYTELYRDNPVKYNPVAGVPYDLVARITGDTLDILLVADPEGAAQVYHYGPFNVTGVNSGKVGLFSWAMSRTEFDWVSVQDGATLYVSSAHGAPAPGRGLTSYTAGHVVYATAGVASAQPGVRHSPSGWTGSGSVPASGTGTNVSFRINTFSRLHWLWQTEYQLAVTSAPGGTVSFPPGEWFLAGSNVVVIATPETNHAFAGWSGDAQSTAPTLNLIMNRPYTLVANFTADSDNDGLPDDWEMGYFGNLEALPDEDPDGDGRTNREEYENGTNPLVADILRIEQLELANNTGMLTISNNTGTRYDVERAITLPGNWATMGTLQFGNSFTSSVPAGDQGYWRLRQPARPVDVPPFVPGAWTLAILPDTQIYSQSYPELFRDQTRWIVANKDRYNIKYVLHLGDIVNNNNATQWANAKFAISILDGHIPYALAPGNHDYGPNGSASDRTTLFNDYFNITNYLSWPTFGGAMVPDKMDNTYHLFSAGDVDWILFALEWGPRNSPVAWASQVLSNYPTRKAILITHAYMYSDETRYDWATRGASQSWNPHSYGTANDPDGTNDGEELWQKLVRAHPNFVMTFNGHVLNDGLARLSTTNDFGGVVHQMLVNFQMHALGGEAFLRLVEFHPDGRTVQIKAYSPYYGTYKSDPQNQFQLILDPPLQ